MLACVAALLTGIVTRLFVLAEDCAPGGCGDPNRSLSEYVMTLVLVVAGTCAALALVAVTLQRVVGAARYAGRANAAGWLLRGAVGLLVGAAVLVFSAKAAAFSAQRYACVGDGRGVHGPDGAFLESVTPISDPLLLPGTRCELTYDDGTTETVFSPWDTNRGAAVTGVVLAAAAGVVAQHVVGRFIKRRRISRTLAGPQAAP